MCKEGVRVFAGAPYLPELTFLIVALTILGVAVGRWPLLRADRATITLIGVAALLAAGSLTLQQAYDHVDLNTLLLLFSMMLLNGNLYIAGFFAIVTQRVVRLAHSPRTLLGLIILASGVLSALFLNDTVVLMLTPIVLDITAALKLRPLPFLLGLATAANVGSAATITGNPQNIYIGAASGISYARFAAALAPTALIGLGLCWLVIAVVHRADLRDTTLAVPEVARARVLRPLLLKSALVVPAMLALFLIGVPTPLAALLAAAALLFTRRLRPERIYRVVDWPLLVFFAGLFVVTGSLETQGLTAQLFALLAPVARAGLVPFGLATVALSNLISNVPAVLLLQGLVPAFPDQQRAWLTLAAASTLAGNLTLLGSVANLIVAEVAARWGVRVTFGDYLRVGLPVTVLTVTVALVLV
jgi:Na+/H+ antiporter NhaD/arsenite permease-like protein